MVQRILVGIGVACLLVVSCQLLFTSDRDLVESKMEELFDIARLGGEDAVERILDEFAEDYRGSGTFSRARVERQLRWALIPDGKSTEIKHGDFDPIVVGTEIEIPIVSVSAEVDGTPVRVILRVVWGPEDQDWKIVDITRWQTNR